MCIHFFKKLFGLEGSEDDIQEMHEYQKTGVKPSSGDLQSGSESSSDEIEFDEGGIYEEENDSDKLDYETGIIGSEIIETIDNENEEVQGASDTDDEAEDDQIQDQTHKISIVSTQDSTSNRQKHPKSRKKAQVKSFNSKAHERFKSKGKKLMNKRKLKMKKKPVEKTEVK